jgi:hypothetical protein
LSPIEPASDLLDHAAAACGVGIGDALLHQVP